MKSVVFDLDGTLINSAPDIQAAVNRMLADCAIAPLDLATVTSFIGNGVPRLVELAMTHVGLPMDRHDELTAKTMTYYNSASSELTVFYDGVLDFLDQLRGAGIRMGLCTNKPYAPAVDILQQFEIEDYFDVIIGGDSLPQRKPSPEPLNAAIAALGGGQVIYVGDSEVDAETAHRAQVPFALFTQGYRKTPVSELPHVFAFERFSDLGLEIGGLFSNLDK